MCGLAGIFDARGRREIDRNCLEEMTRVLSHRGPDGEGFFVEPGIGLGHRRLSIIDLARGDQPMRDPSNTVCVVFNGEIYNFRQIREELELAGCAFRTDCDTEVIVQGWRIWGPDCVNRLHGMFAFAIWDRDAETLFLARDRLGKKPLYYASLQSGHLVFASELKSLVKVPDFSRVLDPVALDEYLTFGYVPEPRSIYAAAKKLEAGHTLLWKRGEAAQISQYWDLDPWAGCNAGPYTAENLRDRLAESVKRRLVADVEVGAFLSGGVDSGAIVAQMAAASPDPVSTYTVSFDENRYDESRYAQSVSDRYHTKHHVEAASPDDISLVERITQVYDEPFGDSSAIPTFRICAAAAQGLKVCLSGDGGDEAFAGYRRYAWHLRESAVREALPVGLRSALFGTLGAIYPKLDWAPRVLRAKTTFKELSMDGDRAFYNSVSVTPDRLRQSLYSDSFLRKIAGHDPFEVLRRHFERADTDDPLKRVQYVDAKTYLPGDILVKVDRASMANSLEVRAPLLDHELMTWALSLPVDHKIRGGQGKYLLKKAMESLLPADILYRPKQGFSVPLAEWFRGPLADLLRDHVPGPALLQCGYFNERSLRRLVEQHQSGTRNHAAVLWLLLILEQFLRQEC